MIDRAAERDPKSIKVWELWAGWAELAGDNDELAYALHQQYRLAVAQKKGRKEIRAIRERLEMVDPIAPDLLDLKLVFVEKLLPIAEYYEKKGRPHSAIRIHNEILSLDPDRIESEETIQRIASRPDPSLADSAQVKDLLEGISEEWIKEFDSKHNTWKTRSKHDGENYTTITDAGYEVMVRAAEAMENVNAFYRNFFDFGKDGGSVPKIELRIFKTRDEYLKYGSSPAEWSGGQFTGGAVETFIGDGGFSSMMGVLFHEVGHQFVSLAAPGARATVWMNEGLATYFEGCRILANGSVQMNLPANHYLFAFTDRLDKGWMNDYTDGFDPANPTKTPEIAPSLEIVIGNKYGWGPPWYAPVWAVTYFFFNYQDPVDGRFIYRRAFRDYTNAGGGRVGEGAVQKIEEVVLGQPAKPTPGVDFSKVAEPVALPRTMKELNETWKEWLLNLRDEQSGRLEVKRPYGLWALNAVTRKENDYALEHFEKGLVETPDDPDFLTDFARFMAEDLKNTDRASKLMLQAVRGLEFAEEVDEAALKKADRLLARYDPKWAVLSRIHEKLWASATGLAQRYLDEDYCKMAMDVAWRFGTELGVPDILPYFEEAVRRSGKSIWLWKLAYNEKNLDGWTSPGNVEFFAEGPVLRSSYGEYSTGDFMYDYLLMDKVTSGDFSMEAEINTKVGDVSFCGFAFGKKGSLNSQAVVLFPGGTDNQYTGNVKRAGSLDLTSFYGPGSYKIWRHNSVKGVFPGWNTLRVDVSGRIVDIWFNGDLVMTHEFMNTDVLRGGFGLITGKGEARYRNIRYLSRPARDPGARIEREITMEKLMAKSEAEGGGGSLQGSWMGRVPAFPQSVVWLQEPRESFDEKGPVPTMIVLWSQEQNDQIPLHEWLSYLDDKYEHVGLEIISIVSAEDKPTVEDYLASYPFPGSVCVDKWLRKNSYGGAFELYGAQYFNLPRVVLLDVNHKVVWEGDPGFRIGTHWRKGAGSYLDSPLDDLLARRNLEEFFGWRTRWIERAEPALHDGKLEHAANSLLEARAFDPEMDSKVQEAVGKLDRLDSAICSLEMMARTLEREECEPALDVLISWAKMMGNAPDDKTMRSLRNTLRCKNTTEWAKALSSVRKAHKEMEPGTEPEVISELLDDLDPLSGKLTKLLKDKVIFAAESGDREWVIDVFEEAEDLPAHWLAREYFKW